MTDVPKFTREWVDRPVIERFRTIAEVCAGRVAIRDANGEVRYEELSGLVEDFAALIDVSVPPGAPVAIGLPAGREFAAAVLAALSTGRAYVPLDVSYPRQRNEAILVHSGVSHALVDASQADAVIAAGACPITLADDGAAAPTSPHGRRDPQVTDTAYVMYTSGSTGEPKGVWQDQRGLLHDVWQFCEALHPGPGDLLSMLYSTSVVGSVRDLFGALLTGATVVTADLKTDGVSRTREWLNEVTILHAMPPVLRSLLRGEDCVFPYLRATYVAGDRFTGADLAMLRSTTPDDAIVYTGIGASECSCLYRDWIIPQDWQPEGELVPVGRALAERTVRLLDDDGHDVAPGEVGRIVVTSPFLAKGYWRTEDPERFRWDDQDPTLRRFDTGDLGRERPDGLLEFLGRADRRAKIRGTLVEPAEIEAVIRAEAGVNDVIVIPEEVGGHLTLVAFVESQVDGLGRELLENLRTQLPAQAVPQRVVVLAELPRLPNQKVDVARLRADQYRPAANAASGAGDNDSLISVILEVWGRLLGTQVDPEMSFADAGGDSLYALELEVALEREGIVLPTSFIQASTRPSDVAAGARQLNDIEPEVDGVLIVFPLADDPWVSREVVDRARQTIRAEVATAPNLRQELARPDPVSIVQLGHHAAQDVHARYPVDTPLYLMGLCFGSYPQWEAARELKALGHTVVMVGVGDARARRHLTLPLVRDVAGAVDGAARARTFVRLSARVIRREVRSSIKKFVARTPARRWLPPATQIVSKADELYQRRMAAVDSWRPLPTELPLSVFSSTRSEPWEDRVGLLWGLLTPQWRVIPFHGSHRFQENLDQFTPAMLEEIRRIDATRRSDA